MESGGLVARLSHATGKPPGVRHLAASLEWWHTFSDHEKMELKKLWVKVKEVSFGPLQSAFKPLDMHTLI
ncbi:MAG: hypothetical protein SGPRY_008071 [Prymnesium sp.]